MKLKKLNKGVAVEIEDANPSEILDALKQHTIVVLKKLDTKPAYFTKLISELGPIANWTQFMFDPLTGEEKYSPRVEDGFIDPNTWPDPATYPVQRVSGEKFEGKRTGIFGSGVLDWHANLNGLDRADGVALQGIKGCEDTSTTWLNTAMVYNDMPDDLKQRCEDVYCEYRYTPEKWAGGLPKAQFEKMVAKGRDTYRLWLIQKNIAGVKGIHFYTNNDCNIITEDKKLYDDLYDFTFQEKYMYSHYYEIGDVVLSDQLLSLHKRDQNDPEILERRVLHRITFKISNLGKQPTWIQQQNKGCNNE